MQETMISENRELTREWSSVCDNIINKQTRIERLIKPLITNQLQKHWMLTMRVSWKFVDVRNRGGRSFPVYSTEAGLRIAGAFTGVKTKHTKRLMWDIGPSLRGRSLETLPTSMMIFLVFLSVHDLDFPDYVHLSIPDWLCPLREELISCK